MPPSQPITRRDFLIVSGTAAAAATLRGAPALALPSRAPYDIILRRGTVFDGTGAAGRVLDVAITKGQIAQIAARIPERAQVEIDAHGLAVAPGFIDIHSHANGTLFEDPRLESIIRQGVTTVVVGQDGFSNAPPPKVRGGDDDDDGQSYSRISQFLDAIEQARSSANFATMVGLGSVRAAVIGYDNRKATPAELRAMTALVERGLADGACGASSGLEYNPGIFADVDELAALCQPLAKYGLPYATHMRNEDDRLLQSIEESITVATRAGCPLEISHLKTEGVRNWHKIDAVFARFEQAHRAGLDIAFDKYPYTAFPTPLANIFPPSSRHDGIDALLAQLADPATSSQLRDAAMTRVEMIGGWDRLVIMSVSDSADVKAKGLNLQQYAASVSMPPYEAAVAMLKRNRYGASIVNFAMSEKNIPRMLAHPLGMVCSDGGAAAIDGPTHEGRPHPRFFGTFPRVLGKYVREEKALSLESAIHKMTGFPASRVHLGDRGLLRTGYAADVVLFDPSTIIDRATFDDPFQYPAGISLVMVNGEIVFRDGQRTAARPGRGIRPSAARSNMHA